MYTITRKPMTLFGMITRLPRGSSITFQVRKDGCWLANLPSRKAALREIRSDILWAMTQDDIDAGLLDGASLGG